MAGERLLLVCFLVSALVVLPLPEVRAQAGDDLLPEVQDPVWTNIISAIDELESAMVESTTRTRCNSLVSIATYDVLASYSEKMDGLIVGGSLRRPKSEHTLKNKQIALAYATKTITIAAYPQNARTVMGELFTLLNLNINITSTDVTTPEGLGNHIANLVKMSPYYDEPKWTVGVQPRSRFGRRRRRIESHWTSYVPKNTAYRVKYLNKWQPLEVMLNNEYAGVQSFVADIMYDKPLVTGFHPSYFKCRRPVEMLYPKSKGYKEQNDRVLYISAHLNDTWKMKAEGVDGAFGDDGQNFLVNKWKMNLDQQVLWNFIFSMSVRESLITAVYWKHTYDTIRPVTSIRYSQLYDYVYAWAGPGKGTKKIRAIDFRQYNDRTDPSPEYPSGAVTYYGTYSNVAEKFLGTKEFGWVAAFDAGSSRIEPGLTPKERVEIHMPTFQDQIRIGREGREAGGVHYQIAVEEASKLGAEIANELHKKLSSLFKMDVIV